MAGLLGKLQLMTDERKTIITVVAWVVVRLLESQGISLDPGWQEALETVLAGLVVIFLRLGVKKSKEAK